MHGEEYIMERHFEQELRQVRERLLEMGGRVEEMIGKATDALIERSPTLCSEVLEGDRRVDRMEILIDEACYSILVRHHPTAGDLRFLIAVMKIVNDLERIGDSAVNICQAVEHLNQEPPLKPYIDLPRMSKLTAAMVRDALDALVRQDAAQAARVTEADDEVDTLYRHLFRELVGFMTEDPKTTRRAVHLLLVARNLERIADHATNIAEDVIYYVEGRDVRHPGQRETKEEPAGVH
jgi:phosphate transport system protein